MTKRSYLMLATALAVAGLAFVFWDRIPAFEDLKGNLDALLHRADQSPIGFRIVFFVAYAGIVAFSIPAGSVMTLAAGAVFGLWEGALMASFASSLGALLAFLATRYLFRDILRRRFEKPFKVVDEGISRDGRLYLFSLRTIPIFPFFLVNIAMALTRIRAWTFYWVSQLGMLPGTILFVNAGSQLAEIDDPSDILSPGVLASFALLGLFPWLSKTAFSLYRRRALYAPFVRPKRFDRNLVVIGAGAAGLVSAYIAAAVRAKVTLVEAHKMGGDCLNYGCVPSKALLASARLAHGMRQAGSEGLVATPGTVDFKAMMARIREVIATIAPNDSVERYTKLGVDVVAGYARIRDPWTVEIARDDGESQVLTTRAIIVATGARPFVPHLPGIEESGYVTSDTLWERFADRDAAPNRLVILGGGPIGVELAQGFSRLGSRVTVVEMGERLLAREDDEVSEFARATLEAEGVTVLTGHKALAFERSADAKTLLVERDGIRTALPFDDVVCAVGRSARLSGFGLEDLGIPTGKTVETNGSLQTTFPNILAAGDVAGPFQLTHAAAHQAWYASVNALFGDFYAFRADYRVLPAVTFLDPEIARVGVNEREARERGLRFEVTRYELRELDRAVADSATRGFVKVLTSEGRDTILGATIVGNHAGEMIAEFALAMRHGLGLKKILSTIHAYPTYPEAAKYAAGAWQRGHVPHRLLALVGRFHRWRRG
jgi:pyruvate/2-oxoglutarate dehydrogenase complex dihydrolipoamide dehydrogenase (E3) component/uncharacterized membrane protein YdjX (TVP38/TMEM64 family)